MTTLEAESRLAVFGCLGPTLSDKMSLSLSRGGKMAKRRGRTVSLDGLVSMLSELDKQRKSISDQLRTAVSAALSDVPSPFSAGKRRGRPAGSKNKTTGAAKRGRRAERKGARKRRTISAAGRAKIAAAQRARWAKLKAAKTTKK
jgi:hypothetical protein